MRNVLRPRVVAALAAGAAVAVCLIAGQSANAQTTGTGSTIVTYKPLPRASIRAGVYLPVNSRIKHSVGTTLYCGGVDYVMSREGASTNWYLSADIIDKSSGQYELQMFPITYGMLHYSNVTSATRTYAGWGVGAYITSQVVADSVGFTESNHTTLFGGYFNLGIETKDNVFLDARYHITTSTGSANSGGLEVTAGVRF